MYVVFHNQRLLNHFFYFNEFPYFKKWILILKISKLKMQTQTDLPTEQTGSE